MRRQTRSNTRFQILRSQAGFTLTEQLAVVVIMVLVSIIMAQGIPAARQAYMGAVDASNAQLLLSTAATRLRDELSMAVPDQAKVTTPSVGPDGSDDPDNPLLISFMSKESGMQVSIKTSNDGLRVVRQAVDPSNLSESLKANLGNNKNGDPGDPLVALKASFGASTNDLLVTADKIKFTPDAADPSDTNSPYSGVFTVTNLHVERVGEEDGAIVANAKIDSLTIRPVGTK